MEELIQQTNIIGNITTIIINLSSCYFNLVSNKNSKKEDYQKNISKINDYLDELSKYSIEYWCKEELSYDRRDIIAQLIKRQNHKISNTLTLINKKFHKFQKKSKSIERAIEINIETSGDGFETNAVQKDLEKCKKILKLISEFERYLQ